MAFTQNSVDDDDDDDDGGSSHGESDDTQTYAHRRENDDLSPLCSPCVVSHLSAVCHARSVIGLLEDNASLMRLSCTSLSLKNGLQLS